MAPLKAGGGQFVERKKCSPYIADRIQMKVKNIREQAELGWVELINSKFSIYRKCFPVSWSFSLNGVSLRFYFKRYFSFGAFLVRMLFDFWFGFFREIHRINLVQKHSLSFLKQKSGNPHKAYQWYPSSIGLFANQTDSPFVDEVSGLKKKAELEDRGKSVPNP